jgi:hypothetical protein
VLTYFLNDFEKVPVAPIITGITLVFTFHISCIYIVRSLYFEIFSASFWITFLSPGTATFINIHVPFSLSCITITIIIIIIIIFRFWHWNKTLVKNIKHNREVGKVGTGWLVSADTGCYQQGTGWLVSADIDCYQQGTRWLILADTGFYQQGTDRFFKRWLMPNKCLVQLITPLQAGTCP